jgi:hypothetical protein
MQKANPEELAFLLESFGGPPVTKMGTGWNKYRFQESLSESN